MDSLKSNDKSNEPILLLNDLPIRTQNQDGLGINTWARIIADAAIGTEGPFTMGVFGGWGVGKTSVLQLAKSILDLKKDSQKTGMITVMFNAWLYDKEPLPLIPLIAAILTEIKKACNLISKTEKEIKGLQNALQSILSNVSIGFKGGVPGLGEFHLKMDSKDAIRQYQELKKTWMEQQIEKSESLGILKSVKSLGENNKLVVFIDDLDRCMPDRAIKLLESIKLILFEYGFIFIIAMDKMMLESYLDKRYRREFGLKKYRQGQSYLDKLIQLPLWIPRHMDQSFHSLIDKLLVDSDDSNSNQYAAQFREQIKGSTDIRKELSLASRYNPRQLVRLLNHLVIDQKIYQAGNASGSKKFPLKFFLVARGIRHQSEEIYNFLITQSKICKEISACDELDELQNHILDLAADPKMGSNVKRLFSSLLEREHLCRLLLTPSGKEWLENERRQKEIDQFIFEGTDQFDNINFQRFRIKHLPVAIDQIFSYDRDDIMAGCDKLMIFGKPLTNKVLDKLHELSKHSDKSIQQIAVRTLAELGEKP